MNTQLYATVFFIFTIGKAVHNMHNNQHPVEQHRSQGQERYIIYNIDNNRKKIIYPGRKLQSSNNFHQPDYASYVCNVFNNVYYNVKSMRQHIKHTHIQAIIHECKHCGHYSPEKSTITKHIKSHYTRLPKTKKHTYCSICQRYVKHFDDQTRTQTHKILSKFSSNRSNNTHNDEDEINATLDNML